MPEVEEAKVRIDAHMHHKGKYYSVDEQYVGKKLSILEKEEQVLFYYEGKLIETHPKITDQLQVHSTKSEHLGPWRRAMDASSIYLGSARRLGVDVERFILLTLERGNGFIDNQTIWGVLSFDKNYHPNAVNEACQCALELETITYGAVKRLLKLQGNRYEKDQASQLSKKG